MVIVMVTMCGVSDNDGGDDADDAGDDGYYDYAVFSTTLKRVLYT